MLEMLLNKKGIKNACKKSSKKGMKHLAFFCKHFKMLKKKCVRRKFLCFRIAILHYNCLHLHGIVLKLALFQITLLLRDPMLSVLAKITEHYSMLQSYYCSAQSVSALNIDRCQKGILWHTISVIFGKTHLAVNMQLWQVKIQQ